MESDKSIFSYSHDNRFYNFFWLNATLVSWWTPYHISQRMRNPIQTVIRSVRTLSPCSAPNEYLPFQWESSVVVRKICLEIMMLSFAHQISDTSFIQWYMNLGLFPTVVLPFFGIWSRILFWLTACLIITDMLSCFIQVMVMNGFLPPMITDLILHFD